MDRLSLGTADLLSHVIKIGIDTYPPIQIPLEQTKLSVFADEARHRWPQLFDKLELSSTEFAISKLFRAPAIDATATVPTFVLTPRGPVFTNPIRLPPPIGPVGSEDEYMELFPEIRDAFLRSVGGRECLRIGFVRELMFKTGETSCAHLVSKKQSFAGAELKRGKCLVVYQDDDRNVRITIEPGQIGRATQLPIGGTVVREPEGYGLKVQLDVNNDQLRALGDDDMEEVLTRARALWPEPLLEYLNSLGEGA